MAEPAQRYTDSSVNTLLLDLTVQVIKINHKKY